MSAWGIDGVRGLPVGTTDSAPVARECWQTAGQR